MGITTSEVRYTVYIRNGSVLSTHGPFTNAGVASSYVRRMTNRGADSAIAVKSGVASSEVEILIAIPSIDTGYWKEKLSL